MKTEAEGPEQQTLDGLGVAPGIAIGPAHVVEPGIVRAPERRIREDEVAAECQRLDKAIRASRRQLARLQAKTRQMPESAGEELDLLLEA
ncbi:MAG: phosphoenolpyruvate-utilizing N-terminal domain-containing protein, partial [Alphaproteobacteria bacterium]|nr:phosphoenolpyruvate-utilizing N-terminal domain-containing protein [Alphaproteobacteria bacterium]